MVHADGGRDVEEGARPREGRRPPEHGVVRVRAARSPGGRLHRRHQRDDAGCTAGLAPRAQARLLSIRQP